MAEQQTEQPCWRVVVHERDAGGWWTVCPNRFWERAEAEGWAAGALRRGASNAGVYPEVGGRVQVPGWIKVREQEGDGDGRD